MSKFGSSKKLGKARRHKKKSDVFGAKHAGMTRKQWAAFKRKHGLPRIVTTQNWKQYL